MSAQRASRSGRHRTEEEPADAPDQAKKPKPDNQAAAITDDVLDDIDRVLKEQLGFDENDEVSPEEFDEQADLVVKSYVQKGGQ
jgi:Pup-like protein